VPQALCVGRSERGSRQLQVLVDSASRALAGKGMATLPLACARKCRLRFCDVERSPPRRQREVAGKRLTGRVGLFHYVAFALQIIGFALALGKDPRRALHRERPARRRAAPPSSSSASRPTCARCRARWESPRC
jgi:hypothetical protein